MPENTRPLCATPDSGAGNLRLPGHVAVIMDGNGRWAQQRRLPRIEGHRRGAKAVRMVVEESRRLGIRHLTLFTFSTENWDRPEAEVKSLMKMLQQYLGDERELMLKNQVRLQAIGDLARLPQGVREALDRAISETATMQGLNLTLALSYGGRGEMAHAARGIAAEVSAGRLAPHQVDESVFARHLYSPELPDVDLLIRTSGECRISNFLLWQSAYAELVITPVFWPDFSKDEYLRCLKEYSSRNRRFGLTGEQPQSERGE